MIHCFTVILHPHRLKTERERIMNQIHVQFMCELNSSLLNTIQSLIHQHGTLIIEP